MKTKRRESTMIRLRGPHFFCHMQPKILSTMTQVKEAKPRGPIQIDEIYDALIYDPSKSAEQRRLEVIILATRFESLGYKLIQDRYGNERPFNLIAKDIYHLAVATDPMKYVMHSDVPAAKQMESLLEIVRFYNINYGANIITRRNPTDITDARLRSFREISDDLYLKSDQIFKNLRKSSRQLSAELYKAGGALAESRKFLLAEHESKQNALLNSLGRLTSSVAEPLSEMAGAGATEMLEENKDDVDKMIDDLRELRIGLVDIHDRSVYLMDKEAGKTPELPPRPTAISMSGSGPVIIGKEADKIAAYITGALQRLEGQITEKLERIEKLGQEVFRTGDKLQDLERVTFQISRSSSDPEKAKRLAFVMSNIELQKVKNKQAVEKLMDIVKSEDLEGSPVDTIKTVLRVIETNSAKIFTTSEEYRDIRQYFTKLLGHIQKTEIDLSKVLGPAASTRFIANLTGIVEPSTGQKRVENLILVDEELVDRLNAEITDKFQV